MQALPAVFCPCMYVRALTFIPNGVFCLPPSAARRGKMVSGDTPHSGLTLLHTCSISPTSAGVQGTASPDGVSGCPQKTFVLFSRRLRRREKKGKSGETPHPPKGLPVPLNPAAGGSLEKCVELSDPGRGTSVPLHAPPPTVDSRRKQ